MGLNVSKGNMYEFVTHTWNVIKGECPHKCTYCYMHKFGNQKPIRFDEKELKTDLGSGNFIFVGSSCDMFAKEIDPEWVIRILQYCSKFDNQYLFQTKDPNKAYSFKGLFPRKTSICTTIETNRRYPEMGNSPEIISRVSGMMAFHYTARIPTYVTIEPIMDFDLNVLVNNILHINPKQVNIGADSSNWFNKLTEPPKEKILELIRILEHSTVVHQKKNLKRLLKGDKK